MFYENIKISKKIIVCGKDVWGHKSGHSLFELHKNGIDQNSRIINSKARIHILRVQSINRIFSKKYYNLINLIGETDLKQFPKKLENF